MIPKCVLETLLLLSEKKFEDEEDAAKCRELIRELQSYFSAEKKGLDPDESGGIQSL